MATADGTGAGAATREAEDFGFDVAAVATGSGGAGFESTTHMFSLTKEDEEFAHYLIEENRITQEEAEELLDNCADYTYLFRTSTPPGEKINTDELIISIKETDYTTNQVVIEHRTIAVYDTILQPKWDPKKGQGDKPEHLHVYCFYNFARKGPWFQDLQDFVEHYNCKPYDTDDDRHMLRQPYDHVEKRASLIDETALTNNILETDGILDGDGQDHWYKNSLVWYCFAIFVYFLVGTCYYVEVEGWTVDEAIYFAVIVATTVGYGDNPSITTHRGMLFTTFYVLFGVAMVLAIVGKVYAVVIKRASDFAMQKKKELIATLVAKDNRDALAGVENGAREVSVPLGPAQKSADGGKMPFWHRALHAAITKATAYLVFVAFVGMMFMSYHKNVAGPNEETALELVDNSTMVNGTTEAPSMQAVVRSVYGNFDFVEALYWVVITGTTVGFGDYSAQHPDSRWFLIFYLWFIVIAMGNFLTALQNVVFSSTSVTDIFKIRLDENLINKIDKSGDKKVSRMEWMEAMLQVLDIADGDLLGLINKQFDHLNADGDEYLTVDDIKTVMGMTEEEKEEYNKEGAAIQEQGEGVADKLEQERQRQQGVKTGAGRMMQGL